MGLSQCRNMQTDMNIDIRNMEQALQLQRDRAVISGMDNMDISSKDNMDELLVMGDLRAALSDMRLEVEPSMELPPNMPYMEYMMERQAQTNNNQTLDRNDDNNFGLVELPEAGEEAIGHQH